MKKNLMLIIGCLIGALAFNIFFVPYEIVNGGISGISIIVNHFILINKGLFMLILSVFLLLISFILLGFERSIKCIMGSLIFPIFVYLTAVLLKYFPISVDNVFLATIFGGISFGFGLGLVYKYGFATGGTDIIAQLLNKYLHLTLGNSILIVDGLVVLIGGIVFGINKMLYAFLAVFIISKMIDKVILGLFTKKSFYIVTEKAEEVTNFIMNDLNHGVTIFNGQGAYTKKNMVVLLTVIPSSDYYRLKDGLHKIDKKAFFVVSDSYEVSGGA